MIRPIRCVDNSDPELVRRAQQRTSFSLGLAVLLFLVGLADGGYAATIEIDPSNADASCDEAFENVANTLRPGDVLVLHGGIYSQSCRRAITVNGTPEKPIVIRAADGESPMLTRPADNIDTQNNIEIVSSSYLILRGLRFRGGNTGVRFIGGHHITLEDCEIFETGNNAIAMNSGDSDAFIIRHNHIHHTGLSTSGSTEGEGIYIGCNNDACRTTNSLIEGNYIHHLRGTSDGGNDGIEVKVGSYGNVIRNNAIHDTNIGRQYPCIFVYGGGSDVNIVEGNVMWNCGEAIQVVSDALIRNNIILNSAVGVTAAPHIQVAQMRHVTIVNNTIVGHPVCLYIRWSGASAMTLANNAIYCPDGTAVDASGLSDTGITVRANYVDGALVGGAIDNVRFFAGGSVDAAFVDAGGFDLWPAPGSVLIGNAHASLVPAVDFNELPRTSPYDVGAYETDGRPTNPGWQIVPGFKGSMRDTTPPAPRMHLRVE
jgi:hypothetical protein